MTDAAPRLLFLPVSGAFGMGEYARSLAIAQGVQARWPTAAIRFVLSRHAPYAANVPFPATLLDSSPTFHSSAVIALLESWRPQVVVFDNAGRTAQVRAAKRFGARVVFVSARRRQRAKAFRLRWMRLLDEHWIAYPQFIAGRASFLERLKLKILRRPTVRYLDVILAPRAASPGHSLPTVLGWAPGSFLLVVPGGGTGHPGAADASHQFLLAAQRLAEQGHPTVYVGPARDDVAASAQLHVSGPLPQSALAELMQGALLIVVNGGSTLLQSISFGKACVAVPIAGDQGERIRRCVRAGVALAAALDPDAIVGVVTPLLADGQQRAALAGRAAALGLNDGVGVAVRALAAFL